MWIMGMLPQDLSPRKTRVISFIDKDGNVFLVEDAKGLAKKYFGNAIEEWLKRGLNVILPQTGEK